MGAAVAKSSQPVNLIEFRKLREDDGEIEIPEHPENRVPTDRIYLVVFGVTVLVLIPFLIYTLSYSDVDRLFLNSDDCGNLCGRDNVKYDEWACSGKDYTHQRLWQPTGKFYESSDNARIRLQSGECVASCNPSYKTVGNRCVKQREGDGILFEDTSPNFDNTSDISKGDDSGLRLVDYLKAVVWRIILICLLSLVISVSIMFLLRTSTAAMVWSILAATITLGLIFVGILWFMYYNTDDKRNNPMYLVLAIIFSFVVLVFICMILFLRKKIHLVIALLREAMKAMFAMPQLPLIPILSFFATTVVFILVCTTHIYMVSSGTLTEIAEEYLTYVPSTLTLFTIILNICVAFWATQFIVGIQYMTVAGAVSKWYFAKDKNYLNRPILTSSYVTFRFHLGSIAFGSMVITLVAIFRSVISALIRNGILKICFDYCMSVIEDFLKFLSKNAYILTAMHGKPFFASGKRAAQIIFQNMLNIVAVNYVGDFILLMAHLLVMIIALLLTYFIMEYNENVWIVYLIVAVVSLVIAAICFSVIETVVDTIFLCFCEDSLLNDGMARPYAMSADLMEFVDNAKKLFVNKKK